MIQNVIRLFTREGEYYVDLKEEYDISELAGTVPAVGDFIVDPGVLGGRDRNDPANRTIYEVISRYFLPMTRGNDISYVAVVVKIRTAEDSESDII